MPTFKGPTTSFDFFESLDQFYFLVSETEYFAITWHVVIPKHYEYITLVVKKVQLRLCVCPSLEVQDVRLLLGSLVSNIY